MAFSTAASAQISESKALPFASKKPTTCQIPGRCAPRPRDPGRHTTCAAFLPTTISYSPGRRNRPCVMRTLSRTSSTRPDTPRTCTLASPSPARSGRFAIPRPRRSRADRVPPRHLRRVFDDAHGIEQERRWSSRNRRPTAARWRSAGRPDETSVAWNPRASASIAMNTATVPAIPMIATSDDVHRCHGAADVVDERDRHGQTLRSAAGDVQPHRADCRQHARRAARYQRERRAADERDRRQVEQDEAARDVLLRDGMRQPQPHRAADRPQSAATRQGRGRARTCSENPIAFSTASSPVRSRTAMAIVLPVTSSSVKNTMPPMASSRNSMLPICCMKRRRTPTRSACASPTPSCRTPRRSPWPRPAPGSGFATRTTYQPTMPRQ